MPAGKANGFPDLRSCFKHVEWRPMPFSKGNLIGSDFADKPTDDPIFGVFKYCGFWTTEEAKILFAVAQSIGGYWLEIGGLTGWTAAHLAAAGCHVASVDPMYSVPEFKARAVENLTACGSFRKVGLWSGTSNEVFSRCFRKFAGIVIDGNHEGPQPLKDATNASTRVAPSGVILLHDANKEVVRQACQYLESDGWKARYWETTHGVALYHREGFTVEIP